MIKFFRATRPSRTRDRNRFILQIGVRMYHMSAKESDRLGKQICRTLRRYKKWQEDKWWEADPRG